MFAHSNKTDVTGVWKLTNWAVDNCLPSVQSAQLIMKPIHLTVTSLWPSFIVYLSIGNTCFRWIEY